MKKIATILCLAALLPLGACVSPYGYSTGAWAGYDPSFDNGYKGYERPVHYRDDYNPSAGAGYYGGGVAYGGGYGGGAYYGGPAYGGGDGYGGDYYGTDYGMAGF